MLQRVRPGSRRRAAAPRPRAECARGVYIILGAEAAPIFGRHVRAVPCSGSARSFPPTEGSMTGKHHRSRWIGAATRRRGG